MSENLEKIRSIDECLRALPRGVSFLLKLLRNPENHHLINQRVVELIDNDCVYIKNLILRRVYDVPVITKATQGYILEKCKNESCYVVRMVASGIEKERM